MLTLYEYFSMFPPCEFFLFILYVGILQPTTLKVGKLRFFPRPTARLYLRLNYIAGRLRGLFARTGHDF